MSIVVRIRNRAKSTPSCNVMGIISVYASWSSAFWTSLGTSTSSPLRSSAS
jgi:hypothetical protein